MSLSIRETLGAKAVCKQCYQQFLVARAALVGVNRLTNQMGQLSFLRVTELRGLQVNFPRLLGRHFLFKLSHPVCCNYHLVIFHKSSFVAWEQQLICSLGYTTKVFWTVKRQCQTLVFSALFSLYSLSTSCFEYLQDKELVCLQSTVLTNSSYVTIFLFLCSTLRTSSFIGRISVMLTFDLPLASFSW